MLLIQKKTFDHHQKLKQKLKKFNVFRLKYFLNIGLCQENSEKNIRKNLKSIQIFFYKLQKKK